MSDFNFNCPHCEQSLEVPEEMLGQTIECPACNGSLLLPDPQPKAPPAPPDRTCPSCGQRVTAGVNICGNCMYDIRTGRKISEPSPPLTPKPPPVPKEKHHMSKCPQCGIDRKNTDTPCSICGHTGTDSSGSSAEANGETKACPFCGETILQVARKCKHCGEFLDGTRPQAATQQPQTLNVTLTKSRGIYIILALLFGTLGLHNFYAGRNGCGFAQLLILALLGWLFGLGFFINLVWVFIELFAITHDGNGKKMG